MRSVLAVMCAVGVIIGCKDAAPTVGRQVAYTPPVDVDPATVLPQNDMGSYNVGGGETVSFYWQRPTPGPLTAAAACSRWITGCDAPPDRTIDDCVHSVPACKTAAPWNEPACCPKSCKERYAAERQKGTRDVDAVMTVLFGDEPCLVGVKELRQ